MPRVSLQEMLSAGVHFGHQTRYWNPDMEPYLFGERNRIHIINLEVTQRKLEEMALQIRRLASEGKTILLVGTKRAARDIVREKAKECDMPYVVQRWLGGTLTNFHTVRNSISRLQDIRRMEEESLPARISKKEALQLTREKAKLTRSLGGIEAMERLPDALFVIDVGHEAIAVREARKLGIPVIAVVDSNGSLEGIDTIIPGNDDAIRSIRLYMDVVCEAILEGRKEAQNSPRTAIPPVAAAPQEESQETPEKAPEEAEKEPEAAAGQDEDTDASEETQP